MLQDIRLSAKASTPQAYEGFIHELSKVWPRSPSERQFIALGCPSMFAFNLLMHEMRDRIIVQTLTGSIS